MKELSKYFKDLGYSIHSEFCGYPEKRYVLRFRGKFVASSESIKELSLDAIFHDDERTFKIL